MNYSARSRDLFHSFRAIQRVSSRAESVRAFSPRDQAELERPELESAYQDALDQSENHTTLDYHRARRTRSAHLLGDRLAKAVAISAQGLITAMPLFVIAGSLTWLIAAFLDV